MSELNTNRPFSVGLSDLQEEEMRQAIELMFFAYRDFTGEADAILADYDFGRAHHRVVYFIGRNPDITVSHLLEVLKITKQSLSRVLGQLINEGFVEQRSDVKDGRRRLLSLTQKGLDLEKRLTERQSHRIAKAYAAVSPGEIDGFRKILYGMINEDDRVHVSGFFEHEPNHNENT